MRRPLVGICAAVEQARWASWDLVVTLAPQTYPAAVQAAGGLAVILPPDPVVTADPDLVLDRIDALLLAGGSDIDPATYGADPGPETTGYRAERDEFELALLRRALDRDLPALGICRGMQMLNVACGGTIDQHVPDRLGGDVLHREVPGTYSEHGVEIIAGTLAARAVGGEQARVKSHHHQAVERLGEGLAISGYSATDRIVEAIELPGKRYALGVLWHPEEDMYSNVIGSLVEAARQEVNG
ncbi:MAG: gamma-glutamyl-gamma-aminobutyrate hydrolase family protein [Solirubrobacterales bacterium]